MSSITDFNRIDDCNKINPECIDAEVYLEANADLDTGLCLRTSWGDTCIDLEPMIKAGETLTTLYLSPDPDPNCLVYEPERGDNICINGDDLSRIISMQYLKDVDQATPPVAGDVYMYDGNLFVPFNLQNFVDNVNQFIANTNATITNINSKLTPPADAPNNVRVVFGSINVYHDPNVIINENTGEVEQLNKNHGLYTHLLSENKFGDGIFG